MMQQSQKKCVKFQSVNQSLRVKQTNFEFCSSSDYLCGGDKNHEKCVFFRNKSNSVEILRNQHKSQMKIERIMKFV